MSDFRFLHAADIHLDSPLSGLSRYEGLPADQLRRATRDAFENLIEAAIREAVDFVIIAGDLFDGDWKDMSTGLYFARAMGRLEAAGIRVFILKGNHDAESLITKSLPWPGNVSVFSSRAPQTFDLADLGVALHGQSFPTGAVVEDLSAAYPPPTPGRFNIGVLHTALGGYAQHQTYAPCSVQGLSAKGYDYWALGHVHAQQVVSNDPYIVFPGNLQGRHAKETGPKGAMLVEVRGGLVVGVNPLELDVLRWIAVETDCTDATSLPDIHERVRSQLIKVRSQDAGDRQAVFRLTLTGRTALAGLLSDRRDGLRDEVCAIAEALGDLWLEKFIVRTTPPQELSVGGGDDASGLVDEALRDPELLQLLESELKPFLDAVPQDDGDLDDLRAAARGGDWDTVLAAASLALRTRLAPGGADADR